MNSEEKVRSYYIYPGSFSPCTKSHISSICSIIQFCKRKGNAFTIIVSPANKYYNKPSVFEKQPQETQEPYMYLDENSRFEILIKSLEKKEQLANADDPFHTVEVIDESAEQKNNTNYVLVSRGEYRYGDDSRTALTSDVIAKEYNKIYGIPPQGDGKPDNVFLCLGSDNVEQDIFGWKDPNVIIDNINILKIISQSRRTYLQTTVTEEGDTEYLKTEYMNTQISKRYELTNEKDTIINILNNRPGNDPDSYYYKIKDDKENKISQTDERNYDLDDFEIIDTIRKFDKVVLDDNDSYSSTAVRELLKDLKDSIYINVDTLVNYYVKSSSSSDGSTVDGPKENNGGKTREKPRYSRKKINLLKKNRKTKKKVKK